MTDSNTGHSNTGHSNTGNSNTGYRNTGNSNTGYRNTGNWNTGNRNTGNSNTGDWNTGDWNTGNRNTGNRNTGDWNTGDWNTGYFNTTTPEAVRAFNSDCSREEWDNANKPNWLYHPSPTTWVSDSKMTGQEKVDNPTFRTCGGYLRKNEWHEEWRKEYENASAEDIQAVRDLPNFDAEIFKEITGLDLSENAAPKEIFFEGARYVLASDQTGEIQ